MSTFWNGHDPSYPPYSTQYRSVIFYTSDQQQQLAIESKQAEESRTGRNVYTSIEPYTAFYIAEDYHQKYYLRQMPDIVNDLYTIYPNQLDFVDSTAAARLNGYLGGYGDFDMLQKNIDNLGLSELGKQKLLEIVKPGLHSACPATAPAN